MKYNRLYPIGTIVTLKGGKKKLMITAFYVKNKEGEGTLYDYAGVGYPEGTIDFSKVTVFKHSQIEKVYFIGFNNIEEQEFKKRLNKVIKDATK